MRALAIVLFLVISPTSSFPSLNQVRKVMVRVLDGNKQPVKGIRLRATQIGTVSAPSDQRGVTWIPVTPDVKPGRALSIGIVNPPGQQWILMYPPDDVITVRPFTSVETNYVPITVARRRDSTILSDSQLLQASTLRMLRRIRPTRLAQVLSPAQIRAVLEIEAKRLGFSSTDLAHALETSSNPMQKAAAAMFKGRFSEATELLQPSFDRQAERTFDLAMQLGFALYSEGRYQEAAQKYEVALALKPDASNVLNDLGMLRFLLGHYKEAETLIDKSLEVMRARLPVNDPDIAAALNNKGDLFLITHRYAEAERAFSEAATMDRQRLGPRHPQAARIYSDLGALYHAQGKYPLAKQNYSQALGILNKNNDPKAAIERIIVLISLGATKRDDGDFAGAAIELKIASDQITKLVKSLAISPKHPIIGNLHNEMYGLFERADNFVDAERHILLAKDVWQESLGKLHPKYGSAVNNLASIYLNTSRTEAALPLLEQVLSIWEQAFGADHPMAARAHNNLGFYFLNQKNYTKASTNLERARSIFEARLALESNDSYESWLADVYNNLGGLYLATAKFEMAEKNFIKAMEIWEVRPGEVYKYTASLINLGDLYRRQAKFAAAEPLLQKALQVRENSKGMSDQAIVEALSSYGGLFFVQGQHDKALPHWEKALRMTDKPTAPPNMRILLAQSLNNLGALYRRMGRLEESHELLKRAYELWPQLGLGDSDRMLRTSEHYAAVLTQLGRDAEAKTIGDNAARIRKKLSGQTP
jgi:tetratricopeptide (TPR) repeat protein